RPCRARCAVSSRTLHANTPGPHIAKPEGRENYNLGCLLRAVGNGNADVNIVSVLFRVFCEHIKVATPLKNAGVDKFVLGKVQPAISIDGDQFVVRKFSLWVFIEGFKVRVRRGGIEIEITLFNVFSMIPLRPGKSEEPLL